MLTLVCCAHKHNSEQNTYIYENVIPSFSTVGISVVQEEFLKKYKSMKHSVYRSFDLYIVKILNFCIVLTCVSIHCGTMCACRVLLRRRKRKKRHCAHQAFSPSTGTLHSHHRHYHNHHQPSISPHHHLHRHHNHHHQQNHCIPQL